MKQFGVGWDAIYSLPIVINANLESEIVKSPVATSLRYQIANNVPEYTHQQMNFCQICPEMQVNEMYAPYDKHHEVSSPKMSPKHTYFCQI